MSPRRALVALTALSLLALPATSQALPARPTGIGTTPAQALPFAARSVTPGVDLPATDPLGHDLVLVQLDPAAATDAVDAIARTRADLVQPLAPASYLVWADAAEAHAIRRLDGVTFVGVLPADLRLSPTVDAETTLLRVTTTGPAPDLAALAAGSTVRRFTQREGLVLTIPGGRALAQQLAARPDVYSVAAASTDWALRAEKTAQIITQDTADPTPGYDPLARLGTDGEGVTVAVVDGGVDTTHPELGAIDFTCTDYVAFSAMCAAGSSDDAIGHGTFVTGVVAGDGSTGLGDGFRMGQGVAPGVDVHVQNAINVGARRPSITELFADSSRSGAVIAQNSWGPAGSPRGYDEDTRQADAAVRDADPDEPGNQPMNVVFSIMNGSGGTSTQGAPDEAKNIIAVGGTGSSRAGTDGDDLCTCSAHGPNLDGSRLVDVVAPGQSVASTRAAYGTLCGIPHPDFPSPLHAACTGTSFASPHVSGAAALFIAAHTEVHGTAPSPATVRAALVNTATDLSTAGGLDADGAPLTPVPNEQQGWGRVNLGRLIDTLRGGQMRLVEAAVGDTGDVVTGTVEVPEGATSLRVTLGYTDAPGHGMGGELRSLVNDLDLVVTDPAAVAYAGNDFADGLSRPSVAPTGDDLNNLENVWLQDPAAGTWTYAVDVAALIGDGVPGDADVTDQDLSVVVTVQ